VRVDRRCDAFIRRLERNDPDAARDPHVEACPSCAVELRLAARIRESLAAGREPGRAAVPASFAARTAYIAVADRREASREGPVARLLSSPAFTVTAVLTALVIALQGAAPLVGRIQFDVSRFLPSLSIPGDLIAVAVPILACVAIGALASLRLVRHSV
jgi:hypothetical protein